MNSTEPITLWAVFGSLFLAGLASSLHCIGMCGPILASFAVAFRRVELTIAGRPAAPAPPRRLLLDFAGYHLGRIWTYAALGFGAGWIGQSLRAGASYFGWQRPVSIALAGAVVLAGAVMLGFAPRWKPRTASGECGAPWLASLPLLRLLLASRGVLPRLVLGMTMGLLPCGIVYAMLGAVATMPNPYLSAAGMAAFGLGTLPSLTAVLVASRWVPLSLRAAGTRIAAALIIVAGGMMLTRAILQPDNPASCPMCSAPAASPPPAATPAR